MPTEPPVCDTDRRIDPDQPPVDIDQRAAGIAGIDRGVGLDEEAVVRNAGLGARQGRDDALGHGLADAEGIADRQSEVADLDGVGIAQLQHRKGRVLGGLDPQDREIAARVAQQDVGGKLAPVGKRHLDLVHVLDDVVVGHDEAGRIDDHARAERLRGRPAWPHALAEKAPENRVVEQGAAPRRALDALGVDIDHGRGRLFDHRRETQCDLRFRTGRLTRRLGVERGGEGGENDGGDNFVDHANPHGLPPI